MFDAAFRGLVARCLDYVGQGGAFPDWEVEILLGFSRAELQPHAEAWRQEDYESEMMRAAQSVLVNLLGYPVDKPDKIYASLGTTADDLRAVLDRLLERENSVAKWEF